MNKLTMEDIGYFLFMQEMERQEEQAQKEDAASDEDKGG